MSEPGAEEIELPVPPVHMRVGSGIMLLMGVGLTALGIWLFKDPIVLLPEWVYVGMAAVGALTAADSLAVMRGDTWAVIAGLPLSLLCALGGLVLLLNGLCAGLVVGACGLVLFVLLVASIGPSRRVTRARLALRGGGPASDDVAPPP